MPARWTLAAVILLASTPASWADGYAYPPEKRGDVVARLEVAVQEPPPPPAKGEPPPGATVRLTVTVEGGPQLEVEPPHLADVTDSWKQTPTEPTRTVVENHAVWRQTLPLEQAKPGVVPIPALKIRFRDSPSTTWEEVEWKDILREPRGLPPPEDPLEKPVQSWLPWLLLGLGALAVAVAYWGLRRRLGSPSRPLPPDQWALQELSRIETTALPVDGDAERYHVLLSNVVRRYLAERFQLRAPQQTTAEFLASVRQAPELSADQQTLLRDFLERCDLAKFARAATTPEECRRAAEIARTFVRQTAPTSAQTSRP
jgi:hypothetical protein